MHPHCSRHHPTTQLSIAVHEAALKAFESGVLSATSKIVRYFTPGRVPHSLMSADLICHHLGPSCSTKVLVCPDALVIYPHVKDKDSSNAGVWQATETRCWTWRHAELCQACWDPCPRMARLVFGMSHLRPVCSAMRLTAIAWWGPPNSIWRLLCASVILMIFSSPLSRPSTYCIMLNMHDI